MLFGNKKDEKPEVKDLNNQINKITNPDKLNQALENCIFNYIDILEKGLKSGAIFSALKFDFHDLQNMPTIKLEIVINKLLLEQYENENSDSHSTSR